MRKSGGHDQIGRHGRPKKQLNENARYVQGKYKPEKPLVGSADIHAEYQMKGNLRGHIYWGILEGEMQTSQGKGKG